MAIETVESMRKVEFLILVNTGLILLFLMMLFTFPVNAVVGEDNVTVQTLLEVGNAFPEILNVSAMDGAATFDLNPNATTRMYCAVRVRDYNNDTDIDTVNATLYHVEGGTAFDDPDDNNTHYSNGSCVKNLTGVWGGHADDAYTLVANCTFEVQYYANPGIWDCYATANDSEGWMDVENDTITINSLLALGLPDTIDYGIVNATEVSTENVTNVTNYGNVLMNLSLEGYAQTQGDNLAMNCSLGAIGTIPIYYEKYNLTDSNSSVLNFTQYESLYANLTSAAVIREFRLNFRQDDASNDAINATHWRMYVPSGVAGNCTGNIIFGATTAAGVPYP